MGDAGDITGKPTGEARRFAAFISYSHADAAQAAKLQRRLERYRLPKHIAGTHRSNATAKNLNITNNNNQFNTEQNPIFSTNLQEALLTKQ